MRQVITVWGQRENGLVHVEQLLEQRLAWECCRHVDHDVFVHNLSLPYLHVYIPTRLDCRGYQLPMSDREKKKDPATKLREGEREGGREGGVPRLQRALLVVDGTDERREDTNRVRVGT